MPNNPEHTELRQIKKLNRITLIVLGLACLILLGISAIVEIDLMVPAKGKLAPTEYYPVKVPANGVIESIEVKEGGLVKKEQILAVLSNKELKSELEDAEAALEVIQSRREKLEKDLKALDQKLKIDLESAQTRLNTLKSEEPIIQEVMDARLNKNRVRESQALTEYEKNQSLYEKGLISGKKVEESKRSYELAQADTRVTLAEKESELQKNKSEIIETESALEQTKARQSELEADYKELDTLAAETERTSLLVTQLEEKMNNLQITAPISGRFLTHEAQRLIGKDVTVGETIFTIGSADSLVVDAWLSEEYLPQVTIGQEAKIYLPSLPFRKYRVFNGRVSEIGSTFSAAPEDEIGETGRNLAYVPIKINLDDPSIIVEGKRIELKPGLTAEVEVVIKRGEALKLLWDYIQKKGSAV